MHSRPSAIAVSESIFQYLTERGLAKSSRITLQPPAAQLGTSRLWYFPERSPWTFKGTRPCSHLTVAKRTQICCFSFSREPRTKIWRVILLTLNPLTASGRPLNRPVMLERNASARYMIKPSPEVCYGSQPVFREHTLPLVRQNLSCLTRSDSEWVTAIAFFQILKASELTNVTSDHFVILLCANCFSETKTKTYTTAEHKSSERLNPGHLTPNS